MKIFDKIKKFPEKKRKRFSIVAALFLTLLIIVLNSGLNLVFGDKSKNIDRSKTKIINSMGNSFAELLNTIQPQLDQIFGSTTDVTDNQNMSNTSSSSSSTSNVVE